jgi:hypothetical protein
MQFSDYELLIIKDCIEECWKKRLADDSEIVLYWRISDEIKLRSGPQDGE